MSFPFWCPRGVCLRSQRLSQRSLSQNGAWRDPEWHSITPCRARARGKTGPAGASVGVQLLGGILGLGGDSHLRGTRRVQLVREKGGGLLPQGGVSGWRCSRDASTCVIHPQRAVSLSQRRGGGGGAGEEGEETVGTGCECLSSAFLCLRGAVGEEENETSRRGVVRRGLEARTRRVRLVRGEGRDVSS